jgi:DNA gyrase subunit A
VFVVFENGLAKRTPVAQYRLQGRGGLGIKVAKVSEKGGDLVGALTVTEGDEVLVVMEKGKIVRSRVDEVRPTGRDTSGVKFAAPDAGDAIIAVAKNPEREMGEDDVDGEVDGEVDGGEGEGTVQAVSEDSSADAPEAADGVPSPEAVSDEAGSDDETPEVEGE